MSKPVILCVDDEKIVLDSLKAQLQHRFKGGYNIELAESGQEALEICDELLNDGTEVPLVIVDYVMPEMYGDELLVKIKEKLPKCLSIMLTGQATAEAVGSAVNKAGLFRYIAKPWHEDDFLLTVQTALESFFHQQKIARQQRYNNLLSNVIALTLQPIELKQQLERALNNLMNLPEFERCSGAIYLLEDKTTQLALCVKTLRNQQTFSQTLASEQHERSQSDTGHTEFPIYYQDRLLGTLALAAPNDFNTNEELMELLYSFGDALAGIISLKQYQYQLEQHNANLETMVDKRTHDLKQALKKQSDLNDILLDANSKLDYFASMDGLTTLYNRRFFMKLANAELERSKRYSLPSSFIMLDLDHFKNINDQYGHLAGDYVLEQVAIILKSECREVDLVGRLGGEEFAILSPQSNLSQAQQLAERIRTIINNTQLDYKGNVIKTTASIGITEVKDSDTGIDTVMSRADCALYQSKDTGRNLVTVATPPN